METPREGRHSFRIDDRVHLRIQYLSEREFEHLLGRFPVLEAHGLVAQVRRLSRETEEAFATIRSGHPEIAHYLQIMDRKIEIIASRVEDALRGLTPDTRVNLGTGGLAYWHDAPIPIGAKLELHLVLFPSHVHIGALGRVVHAEEDLEGLPDQRFRIGVEFERVGKAEQEALARHLIELQCVQLRR